jgi:hypothetical protein
MDNLAVGEDAPVCPDEVEDRRADCQIHHRAYDLERDAVNEDERRVRIAVSSDVPVERAFGTEVLDHGADAIDLSFLRSGREPLLLDHDMIQQIGVVEEVTIDGEARRTRATVRFGKNSLANDVFQDVVDGIRLMADGLSAEEVVDKAAEEYTTGGSCNVNGAIDLRLDRPDLQRIGAVHFTGITRLGSEVVRGG